MMGKGLGSKASGAKSMAGDGMKEMNWAVSKENSPQKAYLNMWPHPLGEVLKFQRPG
jgi:hypothetical protein